MRKATLALAALAAFAPVPAVAATFTVINTNTSGAGSLAQAISDANATATGDVIEFNIPGTGVKTIGGVLPAITQPLQINGYTQPGSSVNTVASDSTDAVIRIELSGSSLATGDAVLQVNAGPTLIKGVAINGIKTKGIGIQVAEGVTGVLVQGCFIGTNAGGKVDSSSGFGIVAKGTVSVGDVAAAARNLISGNDGAGIQFRGPSSVALGNLIGTNASGLPVLGNGKGIDIAAATATGIVIGGAQTRENVIAGNGAEGIRASTGTGNSWRRNRFFANGGLGIDLGPAGPTANDEDDADTGANNLQNAPEISLARVNTNLLNVRGLLRGAPGSYVYTVYVSDEPDPSGFGEGQVQVGSAVVVIPDGETTAAFTFETTITDPPAEGAELYISATAEDASQNVSEFSRAIRAVQGGLKISVTNTNDSGAGSLRAAITAANASADPNTIVFAIPGDGTLTISPTSSLPTITTPVLIDGYTQPGTSPNTLLEGSNAVLRVAVNGTNLVSEVGVLDFNGAGAIVRGLTIQDGPDSGIRAIGADGFVVEGCFIGVTSAGNVAVGNAADGINVNGIDVEIGGPNVGQRNVISGNTESGIEDKSASARIAGNVIGLGSGGETLPNGIDGILARGTGAVIGGDEAAFQNEIAGNISDGIEVSKDAKSVDIRGNRIFDNLSLGIELRPATDNAAGVSENDAGDADLGANNLQNFPVLTDVTASPGLLVLKGSLDVPDVRTNTAYRLRAWASSECDASGNGEGERFLGAANVLIPVNEQFTLQLPVTVDPGEQVTMTATDPVSGDTSEFSDCRTAVADTPICGDANGDGNVLSGDALTTLKAAVGTATCELCLCDANNSGAVLSSDAQLVLKKAVGQNVTLTCPACN